MTTPLFEFRPLTEADLALLHEWLNRPHLLRWWGGEASLEAVRDKYLPRLAGADAARPYLAYLVGEPAGYIQYYLAAEGSEDWWPDEPGPGVLGIDQFLADEELLGQGFGTAMVSQFVARLMEDPKVTEIRVDPRPDNVRAVRCYAKVGIRNDRTDSDPGRSGTHDGPDAGCLEESVEVSVPPSGSPGRSPSPQLGSRFVRSPLTLGGPASETAPGFSLPALFNGRARLYDPPMQTVDHSRAWRTALAAVVAATLTSLACAAVGGPAAGPGATGRPRTAADADARKIYDAAQSRYDEGDFVAVDSLASRVVRDYSETVWLGPSLLLSARAAFQLNRNDDARSRASRYLMLYRASDPQRAPGLVLLARILNLEGRPSEAADSLLATPVDLDGARDEAAQVARQVVSQLGLQEIDAIRARWPADHPLQSIFAVERASLLLASGDVAQAKQAAQRALEMDPLEPEKTRAQALLAGESSRSQWQPVLGAVLPMTGALAPYGQAVEEGIRLAVEEYNRRHADSVTLVIRDDHDDYRQDGDLARELEGMGAVGIIGPLRTQGLEQAADDRRDDDLILVSPTAPEDLGHLDNVYSLWTTSARVSRDARAVATFAVRDLKLYRFGVLYPNTQEGRDQLAAFADEIRAWGAELAASVPYDPATTTFKGQLQLLAEAQPQAIFAPAANAQTVIQLAPQFSFYGLRGVQVLGDAEWSSPEVLRLVEPRFIDGTVLATFLDRASPSVRWPEFVEGYERRYRKGLQDSNLVPALAYDAAQLVLNALPWGAPRRSAIARSFRESRDVPGATGILSVQDGRVTRRPFVLEIRDGRLIPAASGVRASMRGTESGNR